MSNVNRDATEAHYAMLREKVEHAVEWLGRASTSLVAQSLREAISVSHADCAERFCNAEMEEAHVKAYREAREKLAATEAHVATLRAALEPFAEAAKYWVDTPGSITHDNVQLWQRGKLIDYLTCGDLRKAAAALAATPADCEERLKLEALNAAAREVGNLMAEMGYTGRPPKGTSFLEGLRMAVEWLKREAIREWCAAIQDEGMTAWLDNTPEPLEPRELLKRLLQITREQARDSRIDEEAAKLVAEAGRERAVRELEALISHTKRFGYTAQLSGSSDPFDFTTVNEQALLLSTLERRKAEIEAEEGRV